MTDRSVQTNAAAELGHDPFVLNLLDRLHEALARANLTARAFKAALDKADLKAEGRLGVTAVKKVAKRLVPKRAAPLYESLRYMLPCGSGVRVPTRPHVLGMHATPLRIATPIIGCAS
jgi:hypothetical protein